jgi:hypothetical protein
MERSSWPPKAVVISEKLNDNNIIDFLRRRELGDKTSLTNKSLSNDAKSRVDSCFNRLSSSISELTSAVERKSTDDIETALGQLLTRMIDSNGADPFATTPSRRQEQESFVSLGGMRALLSLIEPPFVDRDARRIDRSAVERRVEYWNEILVLLREICYTVPNLADITFTNDHICFFFTLLSHNAIFENTMNLIEEILAVKVDTFDLALVPDLYSLIESFNPRHLM